MKTQGQLDKHQSKTTEAVLYGLVSHKRSTITQLEC